MLSLRCGGPHVEGLWLPAWSGPWALVMGALQGVGEGGGCSLGDGGGVAGGAAAVDSVLLAQAAVGFSLGGEAQWVCPSWAPFPLLILPDVAGLSSLLRPWHSSHGPHLPDPSSCFCGQVLLSLPPGTFSLLRTFEYTSPALDTCTPPCPQMTLSLSLCLLCFGKPGTDTCL